jgi:hypothetical protein
MSDSKCECVVAAGTAGAKAVVVAVGPRREGDGGGGRDHMVESAKQYLFAYVMTPQVWHLCNNDANL